jgi:hypothetical protein
MITRLGPLSAALLALSMSSDFCDRAQAQLTVVAKTASAPLLDTAFGLTDGGFSNVTIRYSNTEAEPSDEREGSGATLGRHSQGRMEHQPQTTQAFKIEMDGTATEKAINVAVLDLSVSQIETSEAFADIREWEPPVIGAQTVNIFQLSETLEWRVEPGGYDPPRSISPLAGRYMAANQVGVFASRTLLQKDENTSIKFDAGVNVDTTGAAAGKAGFVMAW